MTADCTVAIDEVTAVDEKPDPVDGPIRPRAVRPRPSRRHADVLSTWRTERFGSAVIETGSHPRRKRSLPGEALVNLMSLGSDVAPSQDA